jgi:molybdopterin converting factor small subunit
MIRVEFYEGARQLAGVASLDVEAATLGEALAAAAARYPALVPRVIEEGRLAAYWRANLNGRAFLEDPATPLGNRDILLILSALAGG